RFASVDASGQRTKAWLKTRSPRACRVELLPCPRLWRMLAGDVAYPAQLTHLLFDPGSVLADIGGWPVGVPMVRVGQHGGQQGGLAPAQMRGIDMEKSPAGGTNAIGVRTELGNIGVYLKRALLGPGDVDQHGKPRFQPLA